MTETITARQADGALEAMFDRVDDTLATVDDFPFLVDPDTGDAVRKFNGLAYSDGTCWARGQGWNIAGLARAITETAAQRYVDALELTLDYYVDNSPDDLVPYWDFEAPGIPDEPCDTSAAALTAYGLTRMEDRDDFQGRASTSFRTSSKTTS